VCERRYCTSGSTDRGARLARIEQERSIRDYWNEQLRRLQKAIGPQDNVRVDEYLESVRDVERRIQMAENQNSRELPVVDQPIGIPADYGEHARLMMDMLALAYQTDLTRVSTFMLAKEVSGRSYPEIGVGDSHHPVSHHQDEPAKLERLHKINEYHFRQFTYLVDKLSKLPEGDGTMLDHTLFLYGTGIRGSNTQYHAARPMASGSRQRTDTATSGPLTLEVLQRTILVPQAAVGVARFSFDALCGEALGSADYLALAHNFHTLLIDRMHTPKANEHQGSTERHGAIWRCSACVIPRRNWRSVRASS
jgi:hypothetical protein